MNATINAPNHYPVAFSTAILWNFFLGPKMIILFCFVLNSKESRTPVLPGRMLEIIFIFSFSFLLLSSITLLYAFASWTTTKLLTQSQSKLIYYLPYWKGLWIVPKCDTFQKTDTLRKLSFKRPLSVRKSWHLLKTALQNASLPKGWSSFSFSAVSHLYHGHCNTR
jgi:hypothetical protein